MKTETKKITFNTLKKYARQGVLRHYVRGEFNGMVDGMEFKKTGNLLDLLTTKTTLEDLAKFKVSKNWISEVHGIITLSNCCYEVKFSVQK